MDLNIEFKHIYKEIIDPTELAIEVEEIFNRIDSSAVDNYNKLSEQVVIELATGLNNEKINLETKQNEVEGLINSMKTILDELRINLNGIFYLSQFDTSFNHFKIIQARLKETKSLSKESSQCGSNSSSILLEDKNGVSLPLEQSDLIKLFNYLCTVYAKFKDDLEAITLINKDLESNLEAISARLVKLGKIMLKKKIKSSLKDSILYHVHLSNISLDMAENALSYYAFNITSWLVPTLVICTYIALCVLDPLNFDRLPIID